jgi:hypothetical protein
MPSSGMCLLVHCFETKCLCVSFTIYSEVLDEGERGKTCTSLEER